MRFVAMLEKSDYHPIFPGKHSTPTLRTRTFARQYEVALAQTQLLVPKIIGLFNGIIYTWSNISISRILALIQTYGVALMLSGPSPTTYTSINRTARYILKYWEIDGGIQLKKRHIYWVQSWKAQNNFRTFSTFNLRILLSTFPECFFSIHIFPYMP